MAKGYQANAEHVLALRALGKDLARRAKSRCELTGVAGEPLAEYEVPPVAATPDIGQTILICSACRQAIEHPERLEGQQWRCLVERMWSDIPAVQVVAARMLGRLARREDWAREALDQFDPDPELRAWIEAAPL